MILLVQVSRDMKSIAAGPLAPPKGNGGPVRGTDGSVRGTEGPVAAIEGPFRLHEVLLIAPVALTISMSGLVQIV